MSELLFSDYGDYVINSRFNDGLLDDWQLRRAEDLDGENFEMLHQHGDAFMLLLPPNVREEVSSLLPTGRALEELQNNMADEMGDILWFAFDAAERRGTTLTEACTAALKSFGVEPSKTINTFEDIQEQAIKNVHNIKVKRKIAMLFPDVPEEQAYTSLAQNPMYVLMRTSRRLSRSLDEGSRDLAPYVASELEPVPDTKQAFGEYMLTLAYVAKVCLEVDMETVARFNMAKLEHRAIYGKANDLKFSNWLGRQTT